MKLTFKHFGIILLVLATAALHFYAAISLFETPDPLFTLNGLGYLGLLGAYFLPIKFFQERHKLVWRVLFGYAIVTILAWAFISLPRIIIHTIEPLDKWIGISAKTAEVILLAFLWWDKP